MNNTMNKRYYEVKYKDFIGETFFNGSTIDRLNDIIRAVGYEYSGLSRYFERLGSITLKSLDDSLVKIDKEFNVLNRGGNIRDIRDVLLPILRRKLAEEERVRKQEQAERLNKEQKIEAQRQKEENLKQQQEEAKKAESQRAINEKLQFIRTIYSSK